MDYEAMTVPKLRALARELGLMPSKGSGTGGRVVKGDIITALLGSPDRAAEVAEVRGDPAKTYTLDLEYEFTEAHSGYEPGDRVINYPRILGQELLEKGILKPARGGFRGSNPRGVVRKPREDK